MAVNMQRNDPIRLMRRRLLILALLVLVLAALRGVWSVYTKEQDSRAMRTDAEQQLAELERREMDLRGDIARLSSERGVEEVLREEYEFGESGEGVIVIVGHKEPPPPPEPTRLQRWFDKTLHWW
jgi:cell division protein FtsB